MLSVRGRGLPYWQRVRISTLTDYVHVCKHDRPCARTLAPCPRDATRAAPIYYRAFSRGGARTGRKTLSGARERNTGDRSFPLAHTSAPYAPRCRYHRARLVFCPSEEKFWLERHLSSVHGGPGTAPRSSLLPHPAPRGPSHGSQRVRV